MYGAVADWCEVLAQQIPAQASFSIEKSIAKVTEQLNRPLALEDVNTMMKPLETDVPASRNRLRDHHEKFENVSKEIKVTQTCEIAGFMRTVSPGQCFKAIYDIDDGVEEKLEHAESIHYTVTMMILSQWGGSVDVQSSKLESLIMLNNMELRFK